MEEMMALMQTDLPEPVAPAMSRWGILARSETSGLPLTSLPRAMGRSALALAQSSDSMISRRPTSIRFWLGTSTPTAALPGMGAMMRTDWARMPERDILVEAGDFLHPHASRGNDFVTGDDGTDVDLAERHLDAEFRQDPQEIFGVVPVFLLAGARVEFGLLTQEGQGRELVVFVGADQGGGLGSLGFLGPDDIELAQGGWRGLAGSRPRLGGRSLKRRRGEHRLVRRRDDGVDDFRGRGLPRDFLLGLGNGQRLLADGRRRRHGGR